MKNLIKFLAIFLVALTFQSCSSDDDPIDENPVAEASYKIYIDGELFSESSNPDLSIINGTLSGGDTDEGLIILIYNVPEIGETVDVDYEAWAIAIDNGDTSLPYVKISGTNVNGGNNDAVMFSGTLTRVSKYKVTFTGVYLELLVGGDSHDFNGEIEVENVINI